MTRYIKLHDCTKNHWVNQDPVLFHIWINLLMDANWGEAELLHNGVLFTLKRGEVFTTERQIAKRSGTSPSTAHRLLKLLEREGMISRSKNEAGKSIITICNYRQYQDARSKPEAESEASVKQSRSNLEAIKKKNKNNNINTLSARARLQPMETYGYDTDKFQLSDEGLLVMPPEERAVWLRFMTEEELDLALASFTPNENYRGGDNLQKHARNHLQSCVRRNKLTSSHRQPSKSASDLMREILAEEDRKTT